MITFNIAIIDADLIGRKKHRFPNLACMKISGYHKEQGDQVTLITDYKDLYIQENIWIEYQNALSEYIKNQNEKNQKLLSEKMMPCFKKENFKYEKIFISKVFTDTKIDDDFLKLEFVEYGGTGFFYDKAEPLPDYIEHHMPDYHLYDDWVDSMIKSKIKDKDLEKGEEEDLINRLRKDFKYYIDYSIGFTTRGCFRKCEFCVNKNYNKVHSHSPVEEFVDEDRKYICLLDDNILGFGQWKSIIASLQKTNKRFEFKQGMDLRLMTDEKAKMLVESKYIGDYIFAFDNIADKDLIEEKLKLWRKYCKTKGQNTKLYIFCAFDRNNEWDYDFWKQDISEVFERIKILMQYCLKK